MAIAAVIFDFGGVITSSPFEAFARYEAQRGLPTGFIRTVNANNPDTNAWARLERSEIGTGEFDAAFRAEAISLGHDVPGGDVLPLLAGDVRPGMVAALRACKAAFKIGCITNNVPSGKGAGMAMSDEKAAAISAVMDRFDHIIESSKAGVRKPDPRIYAMMCAALEVKPSQCIYLDDLGINCKPAAAMGMAAIKVTSGVQALNDLGALLALTFTPLGV